MEGWISLHRKTLDNPIVCKDSDYFSVWCYLLLNATHKEIDAVFKGTKTSLKPGQLLTGRKAIAKKFNINESKVKRILIHLENDQQIDRQRSNKNSLITIINWNTYQISDQQIGQAVTSNRPASDQQVTTNNNVNNVNNENNVNNNVIFTPTKKFSEIIERFKDRRCYILKDEFEYLVKFLGGENKFNNFMYEEYRYKIEDLHSRFDTNVLDQYEFAGREYLMTGDQYTKFVELIKSSSLSSMRLIEEIADVYDLWYSSKTPKGQQKYKNKSVYPHFSEWCYIKAKKKLEARSRQ